MAGERHPWDENEHGLWCVACGYHIAARWTMDEDDDFEPPLTCRQCGFPDFEDGTGYFTDDEVEEDDFDDEYEADHA